MKEERMAYPIEILERELQTLIDGLQNGATEKLVARKVQVTAAIGCLRFCQRHGIQPNANVLRIPSNVVRSPSSSFRLIDDNETDRRELWTEVCIDGEKVRPAEGSLIIEMPLVLRD